jgi:hypothetical protein
VIDFYKLLELPVTATYDEVITACKSLRQRLEAEITTGTNVDTLQNQLSLTLEAQLVLTDPESRSKYNDDLAAEPKSNITDPFADKYFDFGDLIEDDLEDWTSLVDWQGEVTIDIYRSILSQAVHLPHSDIQQNILLAILLTPSAIATVVPILHLYGLPGCGKSTVGVLATKIWGGSPIQGNATFATLRRVIGGQASVVSGYKTVFRNNVFVWEDISSFHLQHPDKGSFFKSGYDRRTSKYLMSKRETDDEVLEIETFGNRIISSIYPFFSDANFTEMQRRILVVQCEKSSSPVIDLSAYRWDSLQKATHYYWEGESGANARRYMGIKRSVVAKLKKSLLPTDRAMLCTDLLATGLTLGVWNNIDTAIDNLIQFYELNDTLRIVRESPLKSVLTVALKDKVGIPANTLKEVVKGAVVNGLIDRRIQAGELTAEMRLLGWELNIAGGIWQKQA